MSVTILEHIKGNELPSGWLEKLSVDPGNTFTVILEPENEYIDENMPPEEMITDKLREAVKTSETDIKEGRYTECKTKTEREAFFKSIWDE